MKNSNKPLILYKRESTETNDINNMKRTLEKNNASINLRKNKLNLLNSINSNLPSTISDSKIKENEKENKKLNKISKPKTTTNRNNVKKEKMKSKGKQIKRLDIENNNNIKFLKKNLQKMKTEGDLIENKITNIKTTKEINDTKNTQSNLIYYNNTIKDINNKSKDIKPKILSLKKNRVKTYNNYNKKRINNISSFDKRKKYIVPIVKKKKKEIKKKKEKKEEIDNNNKEEQKEILASNLIKNKQIEYLKEYQKYMDEYNNKLYRNNEKKFRCIQQEGFDLDELFIENDENQNDTIDEIYEKEDGEEEEQVQETSL